MKKLLILALLCLALFGTSASAQQVILMRGSDWRYLDDGSNQGTSWVQPAFDDSVWKTGSAQLGYGDGDEVTVVGYGPVYDYKFPTTYFRRLFTVDDPSAFVSLTLSLLRDDGAVVYLNGTEVLRSNMPSGEVSHLTYAFEPISGADEGTFFTFNLPPSALVQGTNVLAVEIHQSSPTSSDLSFDLELAGSSMPNLIRGPYLQSGTGGSMKIRWRTDAAADSIVRYGTSQDSLILTASDPMPKTEHEVTLTGLSSRTRYDYSIGSSAGVLEGDDGSHYFVTAPADGQAGRYRVWVLGDAGTADAGAQAVKDAYLGFTGGRYTDLMLMLGDNAYNHGTDYEFQRALFDVYPEILRQTPIWSTLGNHDTGQLSDPPAELPYFDIFNFPTEGEAGGFPSRTERYYSFDYGNVHFISLDSMTSARTPGSLMLTWLESDLSRNTKPWVIAFWHHSPYSKGSHYSDDEVEMSEMRNYAVPILERYGVDLVLGGHSHSYERSFFIDGHYDFSWTFTESMKKIPGSGREDSVGGPYWKSALSSNLPHEGAVYTVLGTSGKSSDGRFDHPAMFLSGNTLGSLVLDFDNDRLDVRFLTSAGVIGDYFTIRKGNPPPVSAPNAPSNPTVTGVTKNSVALSWTDNSSNEAGFEIHRCTGSKCTNFVKVASVAADRVTFTDTGLAPATTYSYRIRGFNSAGLSGFSTRAVAKTLRR